MRRRFAFIHLFKTAGESIECAYDQVAGWDDVILGGPPHAEAIQRPFRRRFGLYKHSTAREVRDVIGAPVWQDLYSFAFVREPMARVTSLYAYSRRLAYPHGRGRRLLQRVGLWRGPARPVWVTTARETSSFAGWLRHPDLQSCEAMRPQVDFLVDDDGTQLVSDVFRFDDLQVRWREVCDRLELGELPLPHANRSRARAPVPVSADDRALVRELMARDYERFGF